MNDTKKDETPVAYGVVQSPGGLIYGEVLSVYSHEVVVAHPASIQFSPERGLFLAEPMVKTSRISIHGAFTLIKTEFMDPGAFKAIDQAYKAFRVNQRSGLVVVQ